MKCPQCNEECRRDEMGIVEQCPACGWYVNWHMDKRKVAEYLRGCHHSAQDWFVKDGIMRCSECEETKMDDDLPDEYVPASLRPTEKKRDSAAYAIGIPAAGRISFAMTHGPTPNLQEMLDTVPHLGSCLIRFNLDGTEVVLYRFIQLRNGGPARWVRSK